MKQLKRALLSTAVLAGLAAGNAYAGTEACFEITKIDATNGVSTFDLWATDYTPAACVAGAGNSTTLAPFAPVSVAYELTGNLTLPFNDFDADAATTVRALPFYIPTTDLPGGSRIKLKLAGATFGDNGDILHLVLATPTANANEYTLESVASTDGAVNNQTEITFVTKAANTVSAGSRLLISRTNVFANPVTAADDVTTANLLSTVVLKLANAGCPTTPNVILTASDAVTDGGSTILGGKSGTGATATARGTASIVVEAESQFGLFTTGTQAGATAAEVNAEVPSLRTEFVWSTDTGVWVPTRVRPDFAWFDAKVVDNGASLDRRVTLAAADRVVIHAASTGPVGSTVRFDAYTGLEAGAAAVASDTLAEVFGATSLSWGTTFAGALSNAKVSLLESSDPTTTAARYLSAAQVFADDDANAATPLNTSRFFTVENTDTDGVMNFNYEVNVAYGINFDNVNYIDLAASCNTPVNTHDVGVNGAVLKVPYTVDATGNFVRISNEHTSDAEITMDVFGENLTSGPAGKETVGVTIGSIPAKSSVVLLVSDLIQKAKDKGYTGDMAAANTNGKRHFMTFTVTAPKNRVHGVSVQKITGGSDRVIPVLDMNDWQQ